MAAVTNLSQKRKSLVFVYGLPFMVDKNHLILVPKQLSDVKIRKQVT